MNHAGDITALSGYELEPVDVAVGGSPCQDLSIAGKRAGLAGERSGLFMEQIRVIKELREADGRRGRTGQFIRPRYMVWENVPGALSSNKGEDFRAVLEETARIADKNTVIPEPPNGKWRNTGCIMGDGWSIAWRILDAQFWGVPQRRRRIALVADFGGGSAPEILFVRKSVSGDTPAGGISGECATGKIKGSADCAGFENLTARTGHCDPPQTLKIRSGCEGGGKGPLIQHDKSATLACNNEQILFVPTIESNMPPNVFCMATQQGGAEIRDDDKAPTLTAAAGMSGNNQPVIQTQKQYKDATDLVVANKGAARRLTPLEYERLQGYLDGWTDIPDYIHAGRKKSASDSARYRALGNSIALPPWKWVLKRISAQYERDATLGSFFDGLGGFPFLWEQINGKGTALWASEIEPFCIAVTQHRFNREAFT